MTTARELLADLTPDLVTVLAEATEEEVVATMRRHRSNYVFVRDGNTLLGTITALELLERRMLAADSSEVDGNRRHTGYSR
jgi:CBS domain-containing protein